MGKPDVHTVPDKKTCLNETSSKIQQGVSKVKTIIDEVALRGSRNFSLFPKNFNYEVFLNLQKESTQFKEILGGYEGTGSGLSNYIEDRGYQLIQQCYSDEEYNSFFKENKAQFESGEYIPGVFIKDDLENCVSDRVCINIVTRKLPFEDISFMLDIKREVNTREREDILRGQSM